LIIFSAILIIYIFVSYPMHKRLQLPAMSASLVFTTAMVVEMGGTNYVSAQGQFETEVSELLTAFLDCWERAAEFGGTQYMLPNEAFVCKALMDNSHAALNHIYNAGTLETYSQEMQDLAYEAAGIIVQYVLPPDVNGDASDGGSAITGSMPSSLSDSFFEALGSGSTSGYLTGGMYGDVCNYVLDSCRVTDEGTGAVTEVPFSSFGNEDVTIDD
jgi:hypothetical protein